MNITITQLMALLLSLALWAAQAPAQGVVEPVRVKLAPAEEAPSDIEFNKRLRDELNKLRDVAITYRRADYTITTVTAPITVNGILRGYVCAALVIGSESEGERRFQLSIDTGATLPAIAQDLAVYLNKEVFKRRAGTR